MTQGKVGREVPKLGDLAQELTARLRHSVPPECIPLATPPGDVGCVCSELTSQRQADDELVDESLDGHSRYHSEQCLRETPAFQEEHDFEEDQEHDDSDCMSNSGKDGSELLTAHAEKWSHTTSHSEETDGDTSVDCDRSESNNAYSKQRIRRLESVGGSGLVVGPSDTGTCVDVKVRDQCDSNGDERTDDLGDDHVRKACTRSVTRQFG